ncbi:MAG: diguanylate cyclase protein [Firmicutes bacterium]|nr:diguanylate cyclase protein [Bacillota bacterium]
MIVAPSIRFNFHQYQRLYGYLKSIGVRLIYDVGFGADIAIWASLKVLDENPANSMITQPCPVIANYIQKYRPELLPQLAPVHSPMMCTAIYLKKYKGLDDRIAFLSPCIGKIDEMNERHTDGFVSYNVTCEKLEQYLQENCIQLDEYPALNYDGTGGGLGHIFSRPGGFRENIEFYRDDIWVRQVDGIQHACSYLDEYAQRIKDGKRLPQIIDMLNCRRGCNVGTAVNNRNRIDDIDYAMNEAKKRKIQSQNHAGPYGKKQEYLILLGKTLHLNHFMRKYEDKSQAIRNVDAEDIEAVFMQLHKTSEDARAINCYACGYGNCLDFAQAVAQGENHIGNCADFNRKELIRKNEYLLKTNQDIKQLHYLATHDFLTNIPNRYYLEEYLQKLIADVMTDQQECALLFIDLDNFKVVNDTFGHASGDQILIRMVDCLQLHLGQETFLARLGGDEFAAVLKGKNLEQARNIANKLLQILWTESFDFQGRQTTVNVTASIGITMIDRTKDTQTLFSHADIALYTAKAEGKNRIFAIEPGDDRANLFETNQVILQINEAFKENRFTLHFQPVFKNNGIILHYEALLRITSPAGGLIYPDRFMPVAERFGLMSKIDRWVVSAALRVLSQYPEIAVFVNISAASLGDGELLKFIETAINKSKISPGRIGFEITETAAIKDLNHAEHWIRRLKLIGCKFALDDFGAGFLSFLHLQRLPVDYLKIDGSFIRNLETEPMNRELVTAMNVVAHALGKATIAEYVENEAIWKILKELQIDCGQGYFLGKPLPLPEAAGMADCG